MLKTPNYTDTHLTCHLQHICHTSTIQIASMSLPGILAFGQVTAWFEFNDYSSLVSALPYYSLKPICRQSANASYWGLQTSPVIPDRFVYFFSNLSPLGASMLLLWGLSSKVLWNHGWAASLLGRFTFPQQKHLLVEELQPLVCFFKERVTSRTLAVNGRSQALSIANRKSRWFLGTWNCWATWSTLNM